MKGIIKGVGMRIERMLVPTDFSPISRMALSYALALARKFRARLTLLHVVEPSAIFGIAFPEEAARMAKDHHDQSLRMLSAVIAPEDQRNLDVETLVKSGEVEQEILSTILEQRTDLLIMGAHGRGLVARYLIGSVTQKVVRNVEIPILVVGRVTRSPAFDRILVPTDFSGASKEALRYAIDLAQVTHSKIAAIHAVEVGVEGGAEAEVYLGEERVREARARFEEWKKGPSAREAELEVIVVEGSAAEVILKAAEDESADLIVITRGEVLGPVAEHMIRDAHVPVLAFPVIEKAKRERPDQPRAA
jgi:nucleotide-binding universal stress UspA family protein